MSRSPLAYPLNRGIDGDAGGAADLQTDIMRFMAILSLCLVAIFALVQSLPMAPPPAPSPAVTQDLTPAPEPPPAAQPLAEPARQPAAPKQPRPVVTATAPSPPVPIPSTAPAPAPSAAPPAEEGFTLRFASDLALTRLVARGDIAFYAIDDDAARQLAVRSSQIRFWVSRRPSEFHEMERSTVPGPVVDALGLTGAPLERIRWGVTLPDRLSTELDRLMREHTGGALVIDADGTLRREST
ncbi:MAG: hypothetical protein AAFX10_06485 [Pseudomonadota bacterium]